MATVQTFVAPGIAMKEEVLQQERLVRAPAKGGWAPDSRPTVRLEALQRSLLGRVSQPFSC